MLSIQLYTFLLSLRKIPCAFIEYYQKRWKSSLGNMSISTIFVNANFYGNIQWTFLKQLDNTFSDTPLRRNLLNCDTNLHYVQIWERNNWIIHRYSIIIEIFVCMVENRFHCIRPWFNGMRVLSRYYILWILLITAS